MFEAGRYYEIREADYMWGTGLLRIHVTHTGGFVKDGMSVFQVVWGFEQCWDGTLASCEREVLVRVPAQQRRRR